MQQPPTLILVVGMHRSGTSQLADLLQHLGVELPGQLVNADHHNPQESFEWQQIMTLQERLLIDLNRWWPSAQGRLPMPPGWLDHAATRAAAAKLRCIIQSTLPHLEAPCWAIKDPRTSRLLPIWLQVAEELHIPLQLLLAVRDPAEVMHSLVKRDGPITGMDGLQDRGQEAARAEFRDLEINVAHLGGEQARSVAVSVAKPFLTALMAISTEYGGDLQLDQLLQAMAHQLTDQFTGSAAIQ